MDKEILVNAPSLEAPWLVAAMASGRTTIVAESVITAPPPVIDPEIGTEVAPDLISERTPADNTAPLYKVLIHNDDVTPLDYVIRILRRVFMLSHELAEHIAETAHHEEVAIVVIRPRTEAEKLTGAARLQARADGYPLTFSMEPDE